MQAKRMEMTVSSTVTMAPAAMYQNQFFMTLDVDEAGRPAWPFDLNFHVVSTVLPVFVDVDLSLLALVEQHDV